jgi:hypothetical protein
MISVPEHVKCGGMLMVPVMSLRRRKALLLVNLRVAMELRVDQRNLENRCASSLESDAGERSIRLEEGEV